MSTQNRCNSQSIDISKIYLRKSIDEIGYFTFSNNSDVIPPNEARPNSIFIFDDVATSRMRECDERIFFDEPAFER